MMPTYWLIQRIDDEWIASAMSPQGESLVQHTPRLLGAGLTPQAALLRAITPLREQHPTADEAARALNTIRNRRKWSLKDCAAQLPVTRDELHRALHHVTESPETYRDWALRLGIREEDFKLQLRDIQRMKDFEQ